MATEQLVKPAFFRPVEGFNRVRIMPSWKGVDELFYVQIYPLSGNRLPRFLVNVGVPNTVDGTVMSWSISDSWFSDIFTIAEMGHNFIDSEEGCDYAFTRVGTGSNTRYIGRTFVEPSPIYIDNWREKLYDLDALKLSM